MPKVPSSLRNRRSKVESSAPGTCISANTTAPESSISISHVGVVPRGTRASGAGGGVPPVSGCVIAATLAEAARARHAGAMVRCNSNATIRTPEGTMAKPSDTSPQPDWNALNQQFWKTWTGAASPATPASPSGLPWHDGLELWSRMFSGQGGAQGDVAERMLAGAKQFAAFAQAATQQASAGAGAGTANPWTAAYTQAFGPLSATSNPMLDAMKSMQGQGLRGFEQLAAEAQRMAGPARDEMMASISLPAFGYTR